MIKEHFIDYLAEIHAENYTGLDDDMPEKFESWCADLGWDELMDCADEWRDRQVEFAINRLIDETIESFKTY